MYTGNEDEAMSVLHRIASEEGGDSQSMLSLRFQLKRKFSSFEESMSFLLKCIHKLPSLPELRYTYGASLVAKHKSVPTDKIKNAAVAAKSALSLLKRCEIQQDDMVLCSNLLLACSLLLSNNR